MSEVMKVFPLRVNVLPIVTAIQRHPELWNQYTTRTERDESPHKTLDDIWVRYNDWANYKGSREEFNDEHESVWYPCSDILGNVKEVCNWLLRVTGGDALGGVLITRIPPGHTCEPHIDGGWHAGYYDKYAVQLAGDMKQAFHFDAESFSAVPGDIYWFDNSKIHWVTNDSTETRMTMVVCIRHERKR